MSDLGGRPVDRWYLFAADVEGVCDLDHPLAHYAVRGKIVREDVMSLLVFTATYLTAEWRQKFQHDITLTSLGASRSIRKRRPTAPTRRPMPEGIRYCWTINSDVLMEVLGCNQNVIHLAKHRGHFDPGYLPSLLRFALFRARPAQRAEIIQALFSKLPKPLPEPTRKQHA